MQSETGSHVALLVPADRRHDRRIVTSTTEDKRMQIDPTAMVARHSTVPIDDADRDQSQPVPYAELAHRVATHGPAGLQRELRCLIRDARRHGVTPLLVTILADPGQPDVARQRAFGRILAELGHPHKTRPHPAHIANDAA
jgi:hypothetical protein